MDADEKDLLHRHLNGDLDGSEQAAFFARLQASADLRREFAALALDETLLSELVLESRPARDVASRRRTWVPAAVAAAMLVGLTLILTLGRGGSAGWRLVNATGDVTLERGGMTVPLQDELRAGDRLLTSRSKAFLSGKGRRLELEDHSAVLFDEKW